MEAVVLAGGESWRMKPHVWLPKPLVELIDGATLLEWQVSWLREHGFEDVYVCARGFRLDELDVHWVREERKLGTGGALRRAALELRGDSFYACNCDDVLLDDPRNLTRKPGRGAAVAVAKPRLPWGVVRVESGRVTEFVEKPLLDQLSRLFADFYVSAGHYFFDREAILPLLPEEGDLERTALPALAANGMLYAYVVKGEWFAINTYKDLLEARRALAARRR